MKIKDAIRTLLFKGKLQNNNQLYTIWGEKLDPEHVLEEYPRPQLIRDNFTILNGYWKYCITKELTMPAHFDGEILVPFSPESVLSGVNRQLKPGEILWYERRLTINKKQRDKHCILHFGAVDQRCEVFINHKKVGGHSGGYLPFSVDITKKLKDGTNLLSLKVADDSETSYHSRGKQKLARGGMFYTAQSGIWQTVWMEWVPDLYINLLKITPKIEDSAILIEINLNNNFNSEKVEDPLFQIYIYEEEKLIQSMDSRIPVMTVPLKNFKYWSPENPFLYTMILTVGKDRVKSYFAMRKIEIKKDKNNIARIYLNNEPYFQNGLLDQGYWPDGLYTAPSDEAMIFDIQKAKELGFNMLRKHIKIEPLRWYYHCDRMGMLVWQDIVNGGEDYNTLFVGYLPTLFPKLAAHIKDKHYYLFGRRNEAGRQEWSVECRETVKHLYNSPSIVVWVPFNEGWGQFDAVKAYELIKEIDSMRLIDHASGWFDQGIGDFESIHNYFHPLQSSYKKRPIIFSEFGGYACYIAEHSYSWQVYGYRIYLTKEDFDEAYQKLYRKEIEKLKISGLSAVVYTQLTDVEDEVNGLLTYDRKVCKVNTINISH
jgi:beta-galactosidase/beta-glucuronidase